MKEQVSTSIKSEHVLYDPLSAELKWQTERFGMRDEDVSFPQPSHLANLDPFPFEKFPRNSIGQRKDVARRIRTVISGIHTASNFQNKIDTSDKGFFTKFDLDEEGNLHQEMIGQGHVDRIVSTTLHIMHGLIQQGHGERLQRVLDKHGIELDLNTP
ncbi:MAG: hypothetical protein ACM3IJ_01620 [Candidatus Levyibacteriota bacterium]